jgi:hypothetical protein
MITYYRRAPPEALLAAATPTCGAGGRQLVSATGSLRVAACERPAGLSCEPIRIPYVAQGRFTRCHRSRLYRLAISTAQGRCSCYRASVRAPFKKFVIVAPALRGCFHVFPVCRAIQPGPTSVDSRARRAVFGDGHLTTTRRMLAEMKLGMQARLRISLALAGIEFTSFNS